jgi:uncharacterized coiled-coil protein SlyX
MFKRALFGNRLPHKYYDLSNTQKVLALIEKDARISELEARSSRYEGMMCDYNATLAHKDRRISELEEKISSMDAGNAYIENGVLTEEQVILKTRISELEAIIEAAPHDENCLYGELKDNGKSVWPCDCYKSKIGSK